MQAIIGITSFEEHRNRSAYASLNVDYARSVSMAGGLPLVLPGPAGLDADGQGGLDGLAAAYAGRLDGLLLSGGGDIAPYLYGEQASRGIAKMDSARDRWELALFVAAFARGLPVLGICRGCQVVNVALGGTLYQDLGIQLKAAAGHSFDVPMDEPAHYVDLTPGSLLRRIFGEDRILTNSFHHQAVKDLAPGLVVSAVSPDGVVEGIESSDPGRFVVAVQFHPEGMTARFPSFASPFRAFVEAASLRAAASAKQAASAGMASGG